MIVESDKLEPLSKTNKSENFDQKLLKKLLILNDFNALNHVKVRVEGRDEDLKPFSKGDSIEIEFSDGITTNTSAYFRGKKVQYIDFNSGGSADDLIMPKEKDNKTFNIVYVSGHAVGSQQDVVDFNNFTFYKNIEDLDGIDNSQSAIFNLTISEDGSTITMTLKKKPFV